MPKYKVDSETRELLEEVLEWASSVANTQIDPEAGDYIQDVVIDLAKRFGISFTETEVVFGRDADTGESLTIVKELRPKPHLEIVKKDPDPKKP